jgi:hypothetical protein
MNETPSLFPDVMYLADSYQHFGAACIPCLQSKRQAKQVLLKRQTISTELYATISYKTVMILTAVSTLHLTNLVSLMPIMFCSSTSKLVILYHL